MQLVEQHCISKQDSRYEVIDRVAFASKNLYNAALYEMRQCYIRTGRRIYYNGLYHLMKSHEAYKALPAKVAQHVLKLLERHCATIGRPYRNTNSADDYRSSTHRTTWHLLCR